MNTMLSYVFFFFNYHDNSIFMNIQIFNKKNCFFSNMTNFLFLKIEFWEIRDKLYNLKKYH